MSSGRDSDVTEFFIFWSPMEGGTIGYSSRAERYASEADAELGRRRDAMAVESAMARARASGGKSSVVRFPTRRTEQSARRRRTTSIRVGAAYERRFGTDVMAHVHACATSRQRRADSSITARRALVTDNGRRFDAPRLEVSCGQDFNVLRRGQLRPRLARRDTLAPPISAAQATTVAKTGHVWIAGYWIDPPTEYRIKRCRPAESRARPERRRAFSEILCGDHARRCVSSDARVHEKMDSDRRFTVSGQTYSRKIDAQGSAWSPVLPPAR